MGDKIYVLQTVFSCDWNLISVGNERDTLGDAELYGDGLVGMTGSFRHILTNLPSQR